MPDYSTSPLRDWGELISFTPGTVLRPSSIAELKEILEKVHRGEIGGGRVRVPGSLHSCSEIAVGDTLVDVSSLPKSIELEDGDTAVTATANVSLHEFLAELDRHGKSVTATGGTDHQTLAGPDLDRDRAGQLPRRALREARVGRVRHRRRLRPGDRAAHLPRRRRTSRRSICSLGLLGVITRVRFGLVDELYFDVTMKVVDLDEVLVDLDATSAKYDFWRVNWMQKSDKALLWAATAVPPRPSRSPTATTRRNAPSRCSRSSSTRWTGSPTPARC